MLFVEPRFFIFYAVIFLLYWGLKHNGQRKILLLAGSYFFYGCWDWRFLSLILVSTLVDYLIGIKIQNQESLRARRVLLLISLTVNLGILALFKYANFFIESFADLLAIFSIPASYTTLKIILPLGVSFYTFQTLSYTIDVYRRKIKAENSLPDFALFVSFFPQLVAGPILRASFFLPQLKEENRFCNVAIKPMLILFLIGFIKKACIADNIGFYVDHVFANYSLHTPSAIVLALVLFSIQIYCDFSGYSDMAIASAGLLGFKIPQNFAAPYLASSMIDFWRRWHISLTSWLRDYIYVPLGGNRGGTIKQCRNIMLTALLSGLWHGANITFLLWGFLHGIALVVNHLWRSNIKTRLPKLPSVILTYSVVCLLWIFFRAENLDTAMNMLNIAFMVKKGGILSLPVHIYLIPPLLLTLHVLIFQTDPVSKSEKVSPALFAVLLGCAWALTLAFLPIGTQPFIYFQF